MPNSPHAECNCDQILFARPEVMVAWEKHLIQILSSMSGDPGRWPQPVLETLEHVPKCWLSFFGMYPTHSPNTYSLRSLKTKLETWKKHLRNWPYKTSWQLGIYGWRMCWRGSTELNGQRSLPKTEYLASTIGPGAPSLQDPLIRISQLGWLTRIDVIPGFTCFQPFRQIPSLNISSPSPTEKTKHKTEVLFKQNSLILSISTW